MLNFKMSKVKYWVIILVVFIFYDSITACDNDWEPFKDEKCFKIFESIGFQTYENAEKTCRQQENNASLVTIHTQEEQDFFANFLFKTHNLVDTVWIGAKNDSNWSKFRWTDGSELSYTNWAEGSPTNKTSYECIQIIPESSPIGKWVDEPCIKKNLVVCQKLQVWTSTETQNIILELRRKLLNIETQLLLQPSVPIGFIYVQMPNQSEPNALWHLSEWKDISTEYAGMFFRAEGGNSSKFGETQEENSPHVNQIKITGPSPSNYISSYNQIADITSGQWSPDVYSGGSTGQNVFLSFHSTNGEVRPRNKAIRIWKRIK